MPATTATPQAPPPSRAAGPVWPLERILFPMAGTMAALSALRRNFGVKHACGR